MSEQVQKNDKKLGLWNIVGLGVGGAVGSGIFVTLGDAMARTGRSILPITVICVFYMLLAYWYNYAMAGIFEVKGGDYSMKAMLLPPLLTGYGGWTNVIWAFGFTGYALALTDYLAVLWPFLNDHRTLASAIILTLFFLLTIRGNRIVTIFQNVATILLIGALGVFIVLGIPQVDPSIFFDMSYDGGFFQNGFAGVISAIAIMAWACQGTTMGPVGVISITEDSKKTVPRGILVTCIIVSIVYGLMSYVASGVLPYDQVAGQNISVAASTFLSGGLFSYFVIGGGVCAIISSFLSVLAMIRDPLANMLDDGWMPRSFDKKTGDGYPVYMFLMTYVVALVPILTGMSVSNAISMLMIPTMLINAYLNASCAKLPDLYPESFANRSFKMSAGTFKFLSILGSLAALVIAITLFTDLTRQDAIVAAGVIIIPLIFSAIALRTNSVDTGKLERNRQAVIEDAKY